MRQGNAGINEGAYARKDADAGRSKLIQTQTRKLIFLSENCHQRELTIHGCNYSEHGGIEKSIMENVELLYSFMIQKFETSKDLKSTIKTDIEPYI